MFSKKRKKKKAEKVVMDSKRMDDAEAHLWFSFNQYNKGFITIEGLQEAVSSLRIVCYTEGLADKHGKEEEKKILESIEVGASQVREECFKLASLILEKPIVSCTFNECNFGRGQEIHFNTGDTGLTIYIDVSPLEEKGQNSPKYWELCLKELVKVREKVAADRGAPTLSNEVPPWPLNPNLDNIEEE